MKDDLVSELQKQRLGDERFIVRYCVMLPSPYDVKHSNH